jgi:hypothetical protein
LKRLFPIAPESRSNRKLGINECANALIEPSPVISAGTAELKG